MPYDLAEHRHRFAVWAAARAAQRGFCGVLPLRHALEACGVRAFLDDARSDDADAPKFDRLHRQWCTSVVHSLEKARIDDVTFGRAAKLVAVYLKSAVVLGPGAGTALARIAHPPIDSMVLGNLASAADVVSEHKGAWAKVKWTQLDAVRYYELIAQLRLILGADEPFWALERFWNVTSDAET